MSNVSYQDKDFTRPEQRVGVAFSSEDLNHPFAELDNDDSLGTVWRTSGYWLIDGANKDLVFNEGASNFTATIDEGEYHSDADFFAEVKAQMEAVGGETYTVSRDPVSKKIKLESSGGTFEVIWTDASNTMAELLGFDDNADSTGATEYEADVIALHTEEHVIWDFGSPVKPQYFAAIGQSSDDIRLKASATIQLMFNHTNTWSAPAQTITLEFNPRGIYAVGTDGIADDFYRYAKFRVVDRDNPFGYIELAKISMGSFLDITQGAVQFPLNVVGIDKTVVSESIDGQLSSLERRTTTTASLRWFGLDAENKEKLDDHFFRDYKTARSFFIFLDRDAVFTTSAARSFIFARYTTPPGMRLVNRGALWEVTNNIRAQL